MNEIAQVHTGSRPFLPQINLDSKQRWGVDWQSTQTVAPDNLTVDSVGDHTVWLSWDAVSYQSDPGGYEVFSSPTGAGVWTSHGWTESKTDTTYPVTGLDPGKTYDFAVVSYTDPHINNQNLVLSDPSDAAMATTASIGCAQPIIAITWGDPVMLSVLGDYDNYLWSTGEMAATIAVDAPNGKWYWVVVSSSDTCEEVAAKYVITVAQIFADGFELGNTSAWSATSP